VRAVPCQEVRPGGQAVPCLHAPGYVFVFVVAQLCLHCLLPSSLRKSHLPSIRTKIFHHSDFGAEIVFTDFRWLVLLPFEVLEFLIQMRVEPFLLCFNMIDALLVAFVLLLLLVMVCTSCCRTLASGAARADDNEGGDVDCEVPK